MKKHKPLPKQLTDKIWKYIYDQLRDNVKPSLNDRLCDSTWGILHKLLNDQLCSNTEDEIEVALVLIKNNYEQKS